MTKRRTRHPQSHHPALLFVPTSRLQSRPITRPRDLPLRQYYRVLFLIDRQPAPTRLPSPALSDDEARGALASSIQATLFESRRWTCPSSRPSLTRPTLYACLYDKPLLFLLAPRTSLSLLRPIRHACLPYKPVSTSGSNDCLFATATQTTRKTKSRP